MVDKIIAAGANVVFCQKGVDDLVQHYFAKAGVLCFRRLKESDMVALSKATGGTLVGEIMEIQPKDLGVAAKVEEKEVGTGRRSSAAPSCLNTTCRRRARIRA